MSEAISRELLGKIVDEVFDGAIEDASVIEDIYAAIKRHEAQHKQSFFAAERDRHPPSPHPISVVDAKPIALISEATLNALMQDTGGMFRVSAPKWPSETETVPLYRQPPPPAEQTTGLNDLIEKSKAKLADMSEEERQAMWQAQSESFVRAMTTPCEHGVLDFEQCPQCRAPAPAEHVGDPCHYCRSGAPKVSCPCHRNQAPAKLSVVDETTGWSGTHRP